MYSATVTLEISEESELFQNISKLVETGEGTPEQILQSLCDWPNVQMMLSGNARAHLGLTQMGYKGLLNSK